MIDKPNSNCNDSSKAKPLSAEGFFHLEGFLTWEMSDVGWCCAFWGFAL